MKYENLSMSEHTKEPVALVHAAWLEKSLTIGAQEAAAGLRRLHEVEKQLDELLAVIKVIEINAEECMDFDEFTAMLVPVDDYHRLIEVVESVKGNQV